jgi:hypothetical protein
MWQRKRLYQFGYKLNIYSLITVSDYRCAVRAKNIFQLIANCCQATSGFDPYSRTGASGIIATKLTERLRRPARRAARDNNDLDSHRTNLSRFRRTFHSFDPVLLLFLLIYVSSDGRH